MNPRPTDQRPERPQSSLYEYMLECEQDFYALPHSEAFAEVLEQFQVDRQVEFVQSEPIVLDEHDLPPKLADAFYFPNQPTFTDTTITLNEFADRNWALNGSFRVGGTTYEITKKEAGLFLKTDSGDGNALEYNLDPSIFTHLLAVMYARTAARTLQRLAEARVAAAREETGNETFDDEPLGPIVSPSDLNRLINERASTSITFNSIRFLLESLSQESGKTTVISRAAVPYPHADDERAIFATFTETNDKGIEEIETKLDVNWSVLVNQNTELSSSIKETSIPESTREVLAHIGATTMSIADYDFSKEMGDIFEESGAQKDITPEQKEWLNIVTIFMTSIGPVIKPSKYLDQNGLNSSDPSAA